MKLLTIFTNYSQCTKIRHCTPTYQSDTVRFSDKTVNGQRQQWFNTNGINITTNINSKTSHRPPRMPTVLQTT